MKTPTLLFSILLLVFSLQTGFAQDKEIAKSEIEELQSKKAGIKNAEREALKIKVERLNEQLENGSISQAVADRQKKEAAELHAANIDDRLAILDKKIALLQRNNNLSNEVIEGSGSRFQFGLGHKNANDERLFGVRYKRKNPRPFKYDKRTYSDFVIALGNTHILGKNSTIDISSPHGGQYYFELGWAWRYRLNKDNNAFRLHYGVSFQTNRFTGDQPLVEPDFGSFGIRDNDGVFVPSAEDDYVISKVTFQTNSLLLPFHLEMGPSRFRKTENSIRYSIKNKFRFGIGGYLGFNFGLIQRSEAVLIAPTDSSRPGFQGFERRDGLQENRFVYGVSAYLGAGSFLFYTKLDLNTLYTFENNKYKMASVGLRVDM